MVNAKALDMTHFEDHVMQAVITTLKLTKLVLCLLLLNFLLLIKRLF